MEREGESLWVRSLASGSDGNCILVRAGASAILIDAGISARAVRAGLADSGLMEDSVRAVLVTHEHSDHTRGLRAVARRLKSPVIATEGTLARVSLHPDAETVSLACGEQVRVAGFSVRSFPVSHDAADPVGYLIEYAGKRLGYATDTGYALPELREHLRGVDLAIVEANHDVDRLVAGPYPAHLKKRILGDSGHLSNAGAGELAAELLSHRPETEIWLAHLSAVNNTPQLALMTVQQRLSDAGFGNAQLQVMPRGRPGPAWDGAPRAVQLTLF